MSLPGFEDGQWRTGEVEYFLTARGSGPALLLLHGFPQTHLCWEAVAPSRLPRPWRRSARRGVLQARDGGRARRAHGRSGA